MCTDLINKLEFCEKVTYLESEHTVEHFRNVLWDTMFFDRTYRKSDRIEAQKKDEQLLKKADRAWRDLVASQVSLEVTPEFAAALDRIVEAAKKELLV